MGWTGTKAVYYKNGNIDRKAECDALYTGQTETTKYEVVKSAMVGAVYYAAIKKTNLKAGKSNIWAAICLTETNNKDYFNFHYKDMDETYGPCYYKCPISILRILSPTENETAKEWRENCWKHIKQTQEKKFLKEGTVINVQLPFDTTYFKKGENILLVKKIRKINNKNYNTWYISDKNNAYCSVGIRCSNKLINEIFEHPECISIVQPKEERKLKK